MRRIPKVIIIGVKKCGTRALLEYLKLHPLIKAPGPEPHFFDRNYHRGLDWYRSKMPATNDHEITIEKTPRYFVSQDVPEKIYNLSPNVKLVVVIRDPVVRAISDFTQAVSKNEVKSNQTFRRRVLRRDGDINTHSSIVKTGIYVRYLTTWFQYFGRSNIHIVSGEDLIANPLGVLETVQDFIGVQREIDGNLIYFNKTRGFPCIRMLKRNNTAKCFGATKGRNHVQTDSATLKRLYDFYRPYNQYLFKFMNKTFEWNVLQKIIN
ncbi:heparan sulfate glucosamine 3-O-sulfotransferase 2-like [Mya arenaria]|uniref:heparan sulfate glucosamine 3-O-sulfotransferase 2-like n=1 Tax=Mya arenaria TaxID=6604 RepID=UPI0022E7AFBB|nr:heparan sulfate glucosamine 3-O-sulfotransferase 2-like [Mya arenaria]